MEDLYPSKKIKTIKIKIVNFCKESNAEMNVIEKTIPTSMTINRLKDLGKRLFNLGNKQLEFSYLTKEVNSYENYSYILSSNNLFGSVFKSLVIFQKTDINTYYDESFLIHNYCF